MSGKPFRLDTSGRKNRAALANVERLLTINIKTKSVVNDYITEASKVPNLYRFNIPLFVVAFEDVKKNNIDVPTLGDSMTMDDLVNNKDISERLMNMYSDKVKAKTKAQGMENLKNLEYRVKTNFIDYASYIVLNTTEFTLSEPQIVEEEEKSESEDELYDGDLMT